MQIRFKHIVTLVLLVFTLQACREKVDWEPYIQEALAFKMDQVENQKWRECRERAYAIANRKVDSIILANSSKYFKNLEYPTNRPYRPSAPELLELMDSVPLQPLFERDSVE